MLQLSPKKIRKLKNAQNASIGIGMEIVWDDENCNVLDSVFLRKHCPCADCEEIRTKNKLESCVKKNESEKKSSALRVVNSNLEQQTNLIEIKPVGNYAIAILWGDGHKNGIYSFEYLKELCEYIKINSTSNPA